ncbi:NEL domain-containing protein [Pseudomonas sp. JR33AA]|uniref:NEL domain-containing protein n=1 Tax=Pseudomonas sp. JR33AA TaxID=2899113 RepID=UPI001F2B3D3F|nr:NEL domain-containing protein [Pseudomonas sp. JR33AA]
MTPSVIPADSIDALIARQLPGWLKRASAQELTGLGAAALRQQRAQGQVDAWLGAITPLEGTGTAGTGLQKERALVRLGRSLFRLDKVNAIAARHIADYFSNDPVEDYLTYRVRREVAKRQLLLELSREAIQRHGL